MTMTHRLHFTLPALLLCLTAEPWAAAQTPPVPPLQPALHDGRHDFDFEVGAWKCTVRYLMHRLTGSTQWDNFEGTVVTRTLPMLEGWNESEMQVESPTTHTRIDILAVRLYNPASRQWSIYGSSIKTGVFDPPQIGQFINGRGEFYAADTWQGRAILIRYQWTSVNPNKTHFEQAFSQDGGKTWETNWIYDGTRATP